MRGIVTEEDLIRIPVPQETETYAPVSNQLLLTKVREIAGDYGYYPAQEIFHTAKNGNVMTGVINFNGFDNEMRMSLGVINSYDKSKSLGVGVGASVIVCTNGMFRADIVEMRKHTGSILFDLEGILERQVIKMKHEYDSMIDFRDSSKNIKIDRIITSHLLGEMFFEEELITSTQLSIVKKQINDSTFGVFNEKLTLWQIYNWVTEAYKIEHPSSFLSKHVEFHNYFENKMAEYV